MEKGRKRPPAAFKLWEGGGRGTFPECSFGDKELNLANQSASAGYTPISVRRLSANQRRVYGEI